MHEQPIWIPYKKNHIAAVLHIPSTKKKYPTVILCHGFMGDKLGPWPWGFVEFARRLAKQNFAVLRFDFFGGGESGGEFKNQSITTELKDLKKIVSWVTKQPWYNLKIGIVGHSRGGSVGLIEASQNKQINTVVAWAAPAEWESIWGSTAATIRKKGVVKESTLEMTKRLVDDDFSHYQPITKFGEKIIQPVLIVQGTKDGDFPGSVPPGHASMLYQSIASSKKKLHLIKNAGHLFYKPLKREELFQVTEKWLSKILQ
jgi:uncharacterized protein